MPIKVLIYRDIRVGDSRFPKGKSRIEYDSYHEKSRKLHQLIYQQGPNYGAVGDCCAYLSHEELQRLIDDGAVALMRLRLATRK